MHPRMAQTASTSGRSLLCREEGFDCLRRHPLTRNRQYSSKNEHRVYAASRDGAQVRAIAIPWNDGPDQLDRGGTSPWGGWSLEDVEETEEVVERPASQTQSRGKPLKINRDLLLVRCPVFCVKLSFANCQHRKHPTSLHCVLRSGVLPVQYRAKVARQAAFRAPTLLEKIKYQKEAESMLRRCASC